MLCRRPVLAAVTILAVLSGCGSAVSKDGTPANSRSNNVNAPPSQRMEAGSPTGTVTQAYNRLWPLLCQYDATCDMRLLEEACAMNQSVPAGADLEQCWVVDQQALSTCENELRGLQCQDLWANAPPSCDEAVHQCECLDGYVQAYDDMGMSGCYSPCVDGACSGDLQCYDEVCMPAQEGRCPDQQVMADPNSTGDFGCYAYCVDAGCDDGFTCTSGLCVPDP